MKTIIPDEISDDFWSKVKPLIPTRSRMPGKSYQRAIGGGRKPTDSRKILSAILFVLRNRIAWRAAPKSWGSAQTLHRYFAMWRSAGFFAKLRRLGLTECSEMQGFRWETLNDIGLNRESDARNCLSKKEATPGTLDDRAKCEPPAGADPECDPADRNPRLEISEREPSLVEPRVQSRLLKLHGSTEISDFWDATRALLRDTIPHNAIVAYLEYLDHPKTWKAVRILTSPNARMPADWFEQRWKLDITAPFVQSHQGIKFYKFSDIIQDSQELQRTEYFNRFFEPFGWHHMACLTFWRSTGISSAIALRRTKEEGQYRPGEVEFLKQLHPHLDTVISRLIPSHQDQTKLRWLVQSTQDIPAAFMFLDWDLKPLHVNHEALSQCAIWNFGPKKARAYNAREVYKVPPDIAQACGDLKSKWLLQYSGTSAGKEHAFSVRILHPNDPLRTAAISLANGNREAIFKPGFRIRFDYHVEDQPLNSLPQNKIIWHLTSAERDLLQLASAGFDNAAIAARLNKSINTVKHQLTSIYHKLGVDSSRKCYLGKIAS
jgi:transposase